MVRLLGTLMRNNICGIDHAVFAVRDLDAAHGTFERMGFTLTPRGHHTLGSQNHCIVFCDDYVELLWLPPELKTRPFIADFLKGGEGLAALALKTGDIDAAYAELHAAGLEPTAPMNFSRPVHFAGGSRDARFRTLDIGARHVPCGRLFLCQHQTPELVWRPEWRSHQNGATAIAAVAVVAPDVAATAAAYAKILDIRAKEIAEGLLIEAGAAPIAIITERSLAKRLPGVGISARQAPLMAALFIRVADRSLAERRLSRRGFHPVRMPDGSIAIGAAEAHGVAMVFG
jgi:catechol 2,3-dioxygenase-like lactoylglutathione lyase family enzyme